MKKIYKFNYKSLKDLQKDIEQLNLDMPISRELKICNNKQRINCDSVLNNRLAIHPMEGTDAKADGSPGNLTGRRYKRFAQGGAALIWFEATAVNVQGRANKHQLFLNNSNLGNFSNLVDLVKQTARKKYGDNFNSYLVLQLTHAGRFGENKTILFHEDELDQASGVKEKLSVISDKELESIENDYLKSAVLAKKAGFDAVDIKSCHRYLLSEILAAHTRQGKYGGSYENRTRFVKNVVKKIKGKVDIDLAIRLNIYDSIPYPYGWGTDKENNMDLSEPKRFVKELEQLGVKLFNITASTPYLKPHINRPYDNPGSIGYQPPEHPLIGVHRLLCLSKVVKEELDDSLVLGTGFSWLRQFAPYVAAGVLQEGWADVIGFGREAFAYPDFAYDIIHNNGFDKKKVCLTCGKCTDLKAKKKYTGCVVRDRKVYMPVYKNLLNNK